MGVCFLDIRIMLHLAALNLISHFEPQLSSEFRSFCRAIWSCLFLISLYTRQSSAKSLTLEETTDGKSLVQKSTAYTWLDCCCFNAAQIVLTPPAPRNGGPFLPFLGQAGQVDPLVGWRSCY